MTTIRILKTPAACVSGHAHDAHALARALAEAIEAKDVSRMKDICASMQFLANDIRGTAEILHRAEGN